MSKKMFMIINMFVLLSLLIAACGGSATPIGDAVAGQKAFASTCVSCHGPDAKGLPNLGKDLTTSEFVKTKTDLELVEFLKVGRPASDPLNTQGVDMPPKGGNPALTETDLKNIVSYLRTIHQ
jgi:disulfide bond formation protein DsbB